MGNREQRALNLQIGRKIYIVESTKSKHDRKIVESTRQQKVLNLQKIITTDICKTYTKIHNKIYVIF